MPDPKLSPIKKLSALKTAKMNNRLPLIMNINHFVYDRINRIKNKSYGKIKNPLAEQIKNNGYAFAESLIPPALIKSIKEKADKLYAENSLINKQHSAAGLTRIKNSLNHIPECEEIWHLPEIKNVFHSLYGGGFRVFDSDVYRTTAKENPEASFGSQNWHFDNITPNMVKMMVYLTDVYEDTGAMRIIPKQKSYDLRKRGFIKRSLADKFEPELTNSSIALEGKAGTVVFFQPQCCAHRAIEPRRDLRDVIVMMFYPYWGEQKHLNEQEKDIIASNRPYLINPFTGKALQGSYE